MPFRKKIAELEQKIEDLRARIEASRIGNARRTEMDRALSELARLKAERLRLMLRQVNLSAEPEPAVGTSEPKDRAVSAARLTKCNGK